MKRNLLSRILTLSILAAAAFAVYLVAPLNSSARTIGVPGDASSIQDESDKRGIMT